MDQYIGKMLDNRYEILDVLGVGGMAVVYKARCHRLNRLVAIKILKSDLAQDAELRRRFHDESQAVAMLSHPNIVAVYDVSKTDDVEYIVMELIDGITLKQYMDQRGGKLSWREALHFITQIVKALDHAHSRGIIHRDIKPHNIMVLRDGSVKVADFGIARFTASENTLTQEALGSVHYISPEQARGSRIDARSDLYSAGVVLYEMLTGRLPYEGDSPVAVAIQHINSIPLSPRELNPDLPEALEKITLRAMASDPNKRYPNAAEMLADLEEFRKNPSIDFSYSVESLYAQPADDEPTQVIRSVMAAEPSALEQKERPASSPARRGKRNRDLEDEEYEGQGRAFYIAAIAAILVFVAGVGYFIWNSFVVGMMEPAEAQQIPTLVGISWETVQNGTEYQQIREDFDIQLGGSVASDTLAEGIIADQDPEAGSKSTDQRPVITVYVSAGAEALTIPENIVNMEYRAARNLLDNMGLQVSVERENSSDITKDYVISVNPEEGSAVEEGEIITLTVSNGPAPVSVPPFVGQSLEWAKEWLEKNHMVLGEAAPVPSGEAEGTIIWQSVSAYQEVAQGTVFDFQVSSGPAEETPPPSSEPSEPPATDAPDPGLKTKTITITPPQDVSVVQVEMNGEVQSYSVDHSGNTIYPKLTGTGQQTYSVYYDGVLDHTSTINFDE